MMSRRPFFLLPPAVLLASLAACGSEPAPRAAPAAVAPAAGMLVVQDTLVPATLDASGVAEPVARATLGTKLMGSVLAVHVREGDLVRAGQPLVRIDARDLAAKRQQVAASLAEASAMHVDARTQAARIRALYADSAATRAQLDAVETGLARAEAAVHAVQAGDAELRAVEEYGVVRAPFDALVVQRFVDPGAFAAPGAPLVTVHDARRLRVTATAAPEAVRELRRGAQVDATVGGEPVQATVEGVVPAPGGQLYTINALVDNADGRLLAGSAATLALPQGMRRSILVPASAVRREGDLTGVLVWTEAGATPRWVRLGRTLGETVEVLSGLRVGDQVIVAADSTNAAGGR